jgi:hypothetical protein
MADTANLAAFRRANPVDPINGLTDEQIDAVIAEVRKEQHMAAKKPVDTPFVIPTDLKEKVDAYAAQFAVTADSVVALALRDFFYNVGSGKRPRSSSDVEPTL